MSILEQSKSGGERGIRTPGPQKRTTAFEAAAFNRSAISPHNFSGGKIMFNIPITRCSALRDPVPSLLSAFILSTGEYKWRRERDSNPRYTFWAYTRLAGECLQPLGHLSTKRQTWPAGPSHTKYPDRSQRSIFFGTRIRPKKRVDALISGGGGGIRTPGGSPHNGFQDRRLKPLGHPSMKHPCTISQRECQQSE